MVLSTYQAGQVAAISAAGEGLSFSLRQFDQAMGVAVGPERMAVGARGQVWMLEDDPGVARQLPGAFERCYLPRTTVVTGAVDCHELAWGADGELWMVNTLFCCLATVDARYNFVPQWRPPFVSELAAEDRCHLNGLAMRDGRPAFVTVFAESDTKGGWRADRVNTGMVLDVGTGQAVTHGLAMPHSPRVHQDGVLVLDSGRGRLERVDVTSGARETIAQLPGYTRGLAVHGDHAFVGLSTIREEHVFGGMPIAAQHEQLRCGIHVIDLRTGATVATLEFQDGVQELFDVQVVPDCTGLAVGDPTSPGREMWVVPPPSPSAAGAIGRAEAAARAGERDAAAAELRRVGVAALDDPELLNRLGNAWQAADDQPAALVAYERAVAVAPEHVPALQNLGHLLVAGNRTREGRDVLARALRLAPTPINRLLEAVALPVVHESEAALAQARERYERDVAALVRDEVVVDAATTTVPTAFYAAYLGDEDSSRPARDLGRVIRGGTSTPRAQRSSRARPRVGFLSSSFHDHTIGRLNLGRITHLDRGLVEGVVLTASTRRDPVADAFATAAEHHVVVPPALGAARRTIEEQDLDLLLFADVGMGTLTTSLAYSRMAPRQMATWGHPATTGSPAIDAFLSSALLESPDAQEHYTEQLLLPPTLCTYSERPAPVGPVDRERLGLRPDAHLYGCPQTLFKFHPAFDAVLAGILRADPEGELVLIEGRAPAWTQALRERFARTMPDVAARVRWLAPMPRPEYLGLLAATDVLLDPWPFGGGNTTYEALAVGTPVVTLPGARLRGRITQALYRKMGHSSLIAGSPEQYVQLAVELGTDPVHRERVARELAEASPVLFDDLAEVRDFERVLLDAAG